MAEKIVKDSQCLVKDLVNDCISRRAAVDVINESNSPIAEYLIGEIMALPSAQEKRTDKRTETHASDLIDRAEAIDAVYAEMPGLTFDGVLKILHTLPSVQPERKWTSCSNPPKHHKDVIVRGIEAIGNVTVHKVMQWDVDTWRPTDYAPSVMWKEWSEI